MFSQYFSGNIIKHSEMTMRSTEFVCQTGDGFKFYDTVEYSDELNYVCVLHTVCLDGCCVSQIYLFEVECWLRAFKRTSPCLPIVPK